MASKINVDGGIRAAGNSLVQSPPIEIATRGQLMDAIWNIDGACKRSDAVTRAEGIARKIKSLQPIVEGNPSLVSRRNLSLLLNLLKIESVGKDSETRVAGAILDTAEVMGNVAPRLIQTNEILKGILVDVIGAPDGVCAASKLIDFRARDLLLAWRSLGNVRVKRASDPPITCELMEAEGFLPRLSFSIVPGCGGRKRLSLRRYDT